MTDAGKRIAVMFYRTAGGVEPVREWLRLLAPEERKTIGIDIKTVEFGWPVGMPTCRSLGSGLWEVRSNVSSGRTARVLFCILGEEMYLLHGFIKKSQKTPKQDLNTAIKRMRELTS